MTSLYKSFVTKQATRKRAYFLAIKLERAKINLKKGSKLRCNQHWGLKRILDKPRRLCQPGWRNWNIFSFYLRLTRQNRWHLQWWRVSFMQRRFYGVKLRCRLKRVFYSIKTPLHKTDPSPLSVPSILPPRPQIQWIDVSISPSWLTQSAWLIENSFEASMLITSQFWSLF